MAKKYIPIILILLIGLFLRTHRLTTIPPGLTHDEANHGRDSMNVLDGVLLFYFPLNYGSEPFYNYAVAGSMALVGENLFALRIVNVIFGLLAIAATYTWTRWALGRSTALITAALISISFWPLATSRQALRAGMLPFLAVTAVLFFWSIYRWGGASQLTENERKPKIWWAVLGFAISVSATLHTYLAARVLWLIYPIFLAYLALVHRPKFRAIWRPTLAGLLLAGLLTLPMFAYVQFHPEAQTRLQMLEEPLRSLASAEFGPLLENAGEALLAFVWRSFGDHFLAYNIPGRPVLEVTTALFFLIGLAASLWRWRQPSYAFVLIWFGVGIMPSLITGAEANTTRNMGALPVTYLLPAIGFMTIARQTAYQWGRPARVASAIILALWLILAGTATMGDYFVRWAQSPDVRAAYQNNLGATLDYLANLPEDGPVIISSVYPGPAHDPSIARVLMPLDDIDLRWVDARYGLLFPGGQPAPLILPSSTPLHPAFADLVQPLETINLRPDDLDPAFSLFNLQVTEWQRSDTPSNFGDALELLGTQWSDDTIAPGETAELVTFWQVTDPSKAGPIVPPAFETDVILFTHILDDSGNIVAQRDSLEVPSWNWHTGDVFIQVHPVFIPPEMQPGTYRAVVGVYDRTSGERLPLLNSSGEIVDNSVFVVPLNIDER